MFENEQCVSKPLLQIIPQLLRAETGQRSSLGCPAKRIHVGPGMRIKSLRSVCFSSHCAILHSNSNIFKQFLFNVFLLYNNYFHFQTLPVYFIAYKKIVIHNDDLENRSSVLSINKTYWFIFIILLLNQFYCILFITICLWCVCLSV